MLDLSKKQRDHLSTNTFAFPQERKEPLTDATHVKNAITRFDQVEGVSNAERAEAWERIVQAAKKFDVELQENDWRDLFKRNGHPLPAEK